MDFLDTGMHYLLSAGVGQPNVDARLQVGVEDGLCKILGFGASLIQGFGLRMRFPRLPVVR